MWASSGGGCQAVVVVIWAAEARLGRSGGGRGGVPRCTLHEAHAKQQWMEHTVKAVPHVRAGLVTPRCPPPPLAAPLEESGLFPSLGGLWSVLAGVPWQRRAGGGG